MITVRFPNGCAVEYNNATFGQVDSGWMKLLTKEGGNVIARVPPSCVIEYSSPCKVFNPLTTGPDEVAKQLRTLNRRLAKMEKAHA
jgi:hypothetical protein